MTIKVSIHVGKKGDNRYMLKPGAETIARFKALKAELEGYGYAVKLTFARPPHQPRHQPKNTKCCHRCKRALDVKDHHREKTRRGQTYRRALCSACWRKGWRFDDGGEIMRRSLQNSEGE